MFLVLFIAFLLFWLVLDLLVCLLKKERKKIWSWIVEEVVSLLEEEMGEGKPWSKYNI